jgi:hypothetical protein
MSENPGDLEDFDDEEDQQKGPPKLFIMNLVNSYGNAQLEQLENDGQPLHITSNDIIISFWARKLILTKLGHKKS